jgi:D-alanyl-D-alanine dipeptidase
LGDRPLIRWDRTKGRPEPIAALNKIREVENGEPLVDLRKIAPKVLAPRKQTIPFVRQRVAEMLDEASHQFPEGIRLLVTDAWRPIARQVRIYEWMSACANEAFPNLSYAQLRRRVNRWVAPPDQLAPPGHCTGAAIDVILIDANGEEIDICAPYSRFIAAPTYAFGLTDHAKKHRDILVEAMLGVGFSNCRDEYWHYSFGDAGWAVRLGYDTCCYGVAHLPPDLYTESERLWIEKFADRKNPFLEGDFIKKESK